jgi:hypothetical protein
MKTDELHPERSFELITEVINQARKKFEENGFIYMFWGMMIALISFGQFVLLKNEFYKENWYPYLLMPLGAVFSFFYFRRKNRSGIWDQISKIIFGVWVVLSLNMMILGFIFASVLKEDLIPVILLLLSAGIIISGITVKSKILIISGVLINLSAFVCFHLAWIYHSLLSAIVAVVAVFIPGFILMIQHRRKEHV